MKVTPIASQSDRSVGSRAIAPRVYRTWAARRQSRPACTIADVTTSSLVQIVLLAALGLTLFVLVWVTIAARHLAMPFEFDEVHCLTAADGGKFILARLRPKVGPSPLPPVLMCHGLAMNRRAFALDPQASLARRLSDAGRDVWVLELRGAAADTRGPGLRLATFDTYLTQDVPAAIAAVLERTGAAKVDWVGFSMGGMLAYAYLGARRGNDVRRLVTIGSPVRFDKHWFRRGPGVLPLLLVPFRGLPRVPFRLLALLPAPIMATWFPWWLTRGLRPKHYTPSMLRRVMANTLHDVPSGVAFQFARWLRHGGFDSYDGKFDYYAGIADITVPTLMIAGSRDALAPPYSVEAAWERIGARDRTYVCVGPASGASDHYDHLDLILGGKAGDEVFPMVTRWLDQE